MATYEVELDEKELEQQLRKIAKKKYASDKGKAISMLAKRAIRLEGKVDMERLEKLILHPAFGMWKDREDMKDSVAWVNEMKKKGGRRSKPKSKDFTKLSFYGMWRGREDMKDSVAWVNATRKARSERRRARHESR